MKTIFNKNRSTLFTPPCLSIRERMIFALYDHFSVTTYEAYIKDKVREEDIDQMEIDYFDLLEAMGEQELLIEYEEKIGHLL